MTGPARRQPEPSARGARLAAQDSRLRTHNSELREYNLPRSGISNAEDDKVADDPIDAWLRAAVADAERRGLPELKPLLETLARSTRQLRAAEWIDYVPRSEK